MDRLYSLGWSNGFTAETSRGLFFLRRADLTSRRPSGYGPAVTAFDPDADLSDDLALRLMANTFVTLFRRRRLLDETTA